MAILYQRAESKSSVAARAKMKNVKACEISVHRSLWNLSRSWAACLSASQPGEANAACSGWWIWLNLDCGQYSTSWTSRRCSLRRHPPSERRTQSLSSFSGSPATSRWTGITSQVNLVQSVSSQVVNESAVSTGSLFLNGLTCTHYRRPSCSGLLKTTGICPLDSNFLFLCNKHEFCSKGSHRKKQICLKKGTPKMGPFWKKCKLFYQVSGYEIFVSFWHTHSLNFPGWGRALPWEANQIKFSFFLERSPSRKED